MSSVDLSRKNIPYFILCLFNHLCFRKKKKTCKKNKLILKSLMFFLSVSVCVCLHDMLLMDPVPRRLAASDFGPAIPLFKSVMHWVDVVLDTVCWKPVEFPSGGDMNPCHLINLMGISTFVVLGSNGPV
jgi:hypothetical protein